MTIISFENKFIFLKTKKVAGTSIEAVLRSLTGPNDIVPAVTPRDEFYSAKKGEYSKNYLRNAEDELRYTELVVNHQFSEAIEFLGTRKKKAASHMSYQMIEDLIKKRDMDITDFYVFTVDRHPYSWLVSSCLYNNNDYNAGKLHSSVIDFERLNKSVSMFLDRNSVREHINWALYTKQDKVVVDRVLKYESLSTDLPELAKSLCSKRKIDDLPDLKKNARHIDSMAVLHDEIKEKAQFIFKGVFDYLAYEK